MRADLYFDEWGFRRQPLELLRDGVGVSLQDQPLRVLDELLARPGEVVTREQLIARLWPKRIVEYDAGLNAAVRRLRGVLGDEADTPRYIETVPRKGYRFIGILRPLSTEETAAHSDREITYSPVTLGTYRPAVVLAVSMTVILLGVMGIGQWHKSVAADTNAINVKEQLSRASFFTQRRVPGDLARAKQQYEWALSLDPSSARAWAGLASVHWLEFSMGEESKEISLPRVRAAAQKALDLDPRSAEAHLRIASYFNVMGNAAAAEQHRATAAAVQPNDPLVLTQLAADAADDGRWEEAIALQRRALVVEPLSPTVAINLAYFLFYAGRIEEAKREFEQVIELDPTHPDEIPVMTLILEHRYDEALHRAEKWADGVRRNQCLAFIYHALGMSERSDEYLNKLIVDVGRTDPTLIAEVYAFRGNAEIAFQWLQTDSSTCISRLMLASPFLKSLRTDARWAQVTARAN